VGRGFFYRGYETSTITFFFSKFFEVRGYAPSLAAETSNFLQLVLATCSGAFDLALLFIPSYFRGELMTVYQLLDRRLWREDKKLWPPHSLW